MSTLEHKAGTTRAAACELFVPPHPAVLANEDRNKFNHLRKAAVAAYRPQSEIEHAIVHQIAELQWKADRNRAIESAIHNRELLRAANTVTPTAPELRDIEICIAAQEALAGNRTVASLRRDTAGANTQIMQLQRRLQHLQKHWPVNNPEPVADAQPVTISKPAPTHTPQPLRGSAELFHSLYGTPQPEQDQPPEEA